MARILSANLTASAPDTTSVNLSRMLARLQQTLISPDSATESRLRSSSLEREKVGTNIDYARSLLTKLEQDVQTIKVQARKQEAQIELVKKREGLNRLSERLQELNELGDHETDDDSSDGEDLLGDDTPSETTDERMSHAESIPVTPSEAAPAAFESEPYSPPLISEKEEVIKHAEPELISTLRSRNPRSELFGFAQTKGISTAISEALLSHNRTEQESLTNSLLSMASALKESSQAFSSSLEDEKSILNRTVEGLDRNEIGLEAAQRRMGYLRSMTEGKGWWGRMLMYAWIAGLMVVAILIVFVGPKLRF